MSYTANLVRQKKLVKLLEQVIIGSDAKSVYENSNLQREVEKCSVDAMSDCIQWHGKQKRNGGDPYYLHPIRVAAYAEVFIDDKDVSPLTIRNICLLHDVLEDTNINPDVIKNKYGEVVLSHVIELTNVFTKENYPGLNRAQRKIREHDRLAACSELSRKIKLLDRYDNLDPIKLASNIRYLQETESLVEKLKIKGSLTNLLKDRIESFKKK